MIESKTELTLNAASVKRPRESHDENVSAHGGEVEMPLFHKVAPMAFPHPDEFIPGVLADEIKRTCLQMTRIQLLRVGTDSANKDGVCMYLGHDFAIAR